MIENKILNLIPKYYFIAAIGWVSRIASALSKIIAIPIVFGYLGSDLYAAFILIVGLSSWFSIIDFGVGKSLQNYLSAAHVQGENSNALLGNTVILLMLLSIVSIGFYSVIAYPLQYLLLHNIAYDVARYQWYILLVVGNIYILTSLLNISFNVFFAEFRAHWTYIYQFLQAVSSVIAVFLVRYFYLGDNRFFVVLLFWAGAPFLIAIIAYLHSFPLRKIFSTYNFAIIKSILIRGIKFWGFSIGTVANIGLTYLIMSQTLAPNEITIYYILERLFNVVFFIYQAVLAVIWPKLSEMFANQLNKEANKMLLRNLWLGVLSIVISTFLILTAKNNILELLVSTKGALFVSGIAIILFGLYYILKVFVETYTVGLQSQNRLKIFWIYLPFQIFIGVTAMYFLSVHYGMNGILLGLILSTLLTANIVLPLVYYKNQRLVI